MRPLTTAELLQVWEEGTHQTLCRRALLLLAASGVEQVALLPIGQRDRCLMRLREWMFGSRVVGVTHCPACGEQLELNFTLDDIRIEGAERLLPGGVHVISAHGYRVRFRLPTSLDLLALEHPSAMSARKVLLERCILSITRRCVPRHVQRIRRSAVPPRRASRQKALKPELAQVVTSQMARTDPQADVQIALVCQGCRHAWHTPFDILRFFWNEIHSWALGTLRDIHILAAAYGWRESDILAISPWRRRIYLEMVQ